MRNKLKCKKKQFPRSEILYRYAKVFKLLYGFFLVIKTVILYFLWRQDSMIKYKCKLIKLNTFKNSTT